MVAQAMQASESSYVFTRRNGNSFLLAHEALPLHLLSLVNRGRPRPSDHQIRLRPMSLMSDVTIATIMGDKVRFAAPICIEGNRFVIHLGTIFVFVIAKKANSNDCSGG